MTRDTIRDTTRARAILPLALLLAGLAASCTPQPGIEQHQARACRVGPDGAPPRREGDRGIGGSGEPVAAIRTADKGIGGTVIVGVITGFASICLAGVEVALPPDTEITIDTQKADAVRLRAGQVAVVFAEPMPDGTLAAQRVAIRHEVIGRIDTVDAGELRVAGQLVILPLELSQSANFPRGMSVAVSGIRRLDGTIVATRIDPAPDDRTHASGFARRDPNGRLHLGAFELSGGPAEQGWLDIEGHYASGRLVADTVRAGRPPLDPSGLFQRGTKRVRAETYVRRSGDRLDLSAGMTASARPELLAAAGDVQHLAIVTLMMLANGELVATDLTDRDNGQAAQAAHGTPPAAASAPAPASAPGTGSGPGTGPGAGGPNGVSQGGGPRP